MFPRPPTDSAVRSVTAVDSQTMVKFWVWGVRNPSLVLAALATASGLTGVADWSIAMMTIMVLGFVAEAANRIARRNRRHQQRQQSLVIEIEAATAARRAYRERAA
jgi:hypothetical protein